jgi:sarcosine oxidase delta subunit
MRKTGLRQFFNKARNTVTRLFTGRRAGSTSRAGLGLAAG